MKFQDYYEVLGVERGAAAALVKKAYFKAAPGADQAPAVDFQFGDTQGVQPAGDFDLLVEREDHSRGLLAVAQGGVHHLHEALAAHARPPAMTSPAATAAEVMMSRLPAYFGRKSPRPSTSMKNETRLPSNTGPFLSV